MKIEVSDFDAVVTVVGRAYQNNPAEIYNGKEVRLEKETQNEFDPDAIAVYDEFGKLGYIGNKTTTVCEGTMSSSELCKAMKRNVADGTLFRGENGQILCKVSGVLNPDKVCEEAVKKYDEHCFSEALDLFLKLEGVFDSSMFFGYISACYLKLDEFEMALSYANKSLEKSPDNKTVLLIKSQSEERLGYKKSSRLSLRKVLSGLKNEVKEKIKNLMR